MSFSKVRRTFSSNRTSIDYFFSSVPYPLTKNKPISIKEFCERLPTPTSRENPLVFYTFSPIKQSDEYAPILYIPKVKPIRQYNDVAAACEWSKDVVGFFFYVKNQLVEYQQILQTAQCSTTIMQQHLKSKLLEFLCDIRKKLILFRAIEELKNILDQIDSSTNGQLTPTNLSLNGLPQRPPSIPGEPLPIGFAHLNNPNSSSASPVQLIQQSIRIYLRSYLQPYEQLKKCEQSILEMTEKEFQGQLSLNESQEPFLNTLWSSNRTKTYSTWVYRTDKFIKDLNDLNESFRKDRLLSTYNRLQADAHFRRRKNLERLQQDFIQFVNNDCYPSLVQIFHDYNQWIRQRSDMIERFEGIQQSYQKQCEDIMNYVEMIDNLRSIVYKNIRDLGGAPSSASDSPTIRFEQPVTTMQSNSPTITYNDDEENKTFMNKIRGTTKKTIQHAEEGLNKLDGVIKQLRTNMQKK